MQGIQGRNSSVFRKGNLAIKLDTVRFQHIVNTHVEIVGTFEIE
mgnify:CR=1 FL=1